MPTDNKKRFVWDGAAAPDEIMEALLDLAAIVFERERQVKGTTKASPSDEVGVVNEEVLAWASRRFPKLGIRRAN